MKKFIISVICCVILFGTYYLYKNKNRLYSKYKHRNDDGYVWTEGEEEKPKPEAKTVQVVIPDSELGDSLRLISERYSNLESMYNTHIDSIDVLNKVIDSLNLELASKPKIKIQSNPFDNSTTFSSNNNNSKNLKIKKSKNEKNPLIARGNDALELQRFFTERYDNR